jgi:hypothetical protein
LIDASGTRSEYLVPDLSGGKFMTASQDKKNDSWNSRELSDQASLKDSDEIQKEIIHGSRSDGDPDSRDEAGSVDPAETPQGREEAKNDVKGAANING